MGDLHNAQGTIDARGAKNVIFRPKNAKKTLRIGAFVVTLRPPVRKDKSAKGESQTKWQQVR